MARDFDGALPHLQLIADAAGISDPLDREVVEAYWLGGPALDQVPSGATCVRPSGSVFRGRCGPLFDRPGRGAGRGRAARTTASPCCASTRGSACSATRGGRPQAMLVLDRCRIRSGVVLEVASDHAVVSRPGCCSGTGSGSSSGRDR